MFFLFETILDFFTVGKYIMKFSSEWTLLSLDVILLFLLSTLNSFLNLWLFVYFHFSLLDMIKHVQSQQ